MSQRPDRSGVSRLAARWAPQKTHQRPEWPETAETSASLFQAERTLGFGGSDSTPRFGVALSGGGNRSAAFSMGVLQALHESGRLRAVDLISAVSGGSYTLSWYLLQQFYAHHVAEGGAAPRRIDDELFDPDGRFQTYVENHATLAGDKFDFVFNGGLSAVFDALPFNALRLLTGLDRGSRSVAVRNSSFARQEYREGIQRAYQLLPGRDGKPLNDKTPWRVDVIGATQLLRLSLAQPPVTFPEMRDFARAAGLPAFVFNTTVRPPPPGSDEPIARRLFELGVAGLGSDSCGYLSWDQTEGFGWEPGIDLKAGAVEWKGFLRSRDTSPFATVRSFNNAPSVSGAALSGTNLARKAARRGLWLMNYGLEYAVPDLSTPRKLLRLSDGGHCENLGLYALLRRGCKEILVVDAEYDPGPKFDPGPRFPSYRCVKDAAARELGLTVSVPAIDEGSFSPSAPVCEGTVTSGRKTVGSIWYLKLSMDEAITADDSSVGEYAEGHPNFPQESTRDQYFERAQFRAYRALGRAIGRTIPAASKQLTLSTAVREPGRRDRTTTT